ncbi:hypothetical protein BSKO_00050 [Bryopsis sp. KO-2023]|nr:hypothetical protein BSKO_00050 [Bryopsis sp. KO-2023]
MMFFGRLFNRTRDLVRHVDAFYQERYGLGIWSLEPIQPQPQPQPQRDLKQWEAALEEREREQKKREEELQEREKMASQVIMLVVVVDEEQVPTEGATQPSNEESISVPVAKDAAVEVLKTEKAHIDHRVVVETKRVQPVKPTQAVRQPQISSRDPVGSKTIRWGPVNPPGAWVSRKASGKPMNKVAVGVRNNTMKVPPKKDEIKKEEMTDEIPKGTSWGDYMEDLSKGVAVVQRPASIVPSRRRKKKNVRCREFEKGFCKFGPDCMFLHEEPVKALWVLQFSLVEQTFMSQ